VSGYGAFNLVVVVQTWSDTRPEREEAVWRSGGPTAGPRWMAAVLQWAADTSGKEVLWPHAVGHAGRRKTNRAGKEVRRPNSVWQSRHRNRYPSDQVATTTVRTWHVSYAPYLTKGH